MKTYNILLVAVMLSFLLALSGCGKGDAEEPVPAVEISDVEDTGAEEPELPDDAVQDVDSDVAEDQLSPEGAGAEPEMPAEEGTVDDGAEVTDVTDEVEKGSDALTADNYRVISLKDLKAYPEEMRISVGTTVEWRNVNDNLQHIIGWRGQTGMGVRPEPILQGESWSYTFTEPGEIKWFSTARPTIQGIIHVEE